MRVRRRASIAVGLLVAVVAAVLIPGLLRLSTASPPVTPSHKNPKVTVGIVRRDAPRGVIAQGAIDGKAWRITLSRMGKNLCVGISPKSPDAVCGEGDAAVPAAWPLALEGTGDGRIDALDGTVATKVTRVGIVLSDGVALSLHPVGFAGRRWIGVELPAVLRITRVVVYSRGRELAHAFPFTAPDGLPSVSDWQRPGQATPPQFARLIGSGVSAGKRWTATAHLGPWGLCIVPVIPGDNASTECTSSLAKRPGDIVDASTPGKFTLTVEVAQPRVNHLLLSMTDGSKQRVPVVQVGNLRLYAIVIIHGLRIAHWAAYDAAGHRLYGGQGGAAFAP